MKIPGYLRLAFTVAAAATLGCDGGPRDPVSRKEASMDRTGFGIPEAFSDRPLLPGREMQFAAWRMFAGFPSVSSLERELGCRFPPAFVDFCREHDGGLLEGFLVFNSTECKGLFASRFLGFGEPAPGENPFNEDIIAVALGATPCFRSGHLSSYVPFACVHGSIAEAEQGSPWNGEGFLAFERSDGSVHLVSPRLGKALPVAEDFSSFLDRSAFLRD